MLYDKLQNTVHTVVQPVYNRSEPVQTRTNYRAALDSLDKQKRLWTVKAQRNGTKKRYVSFKTAALVVTLSLCTIYTITKHNITVQVSLWLLALSVLTVTDPIDILGRFLAQQSRILIAIMFFSLSLTATVKNADTTIITICYSLLAAALIYLKNKTWLAAYNWLASAEVQKILHIDPDNISAKSWQAHGRRECRTMLYELGYSTNDEVLDIFHKPIYLLGYLHGVKKNKDISCTLEELESLKTQNTALEKENKELKQENKEVIRELNITKDARSDNAAYWRSKITSLEKENKMLKAANEELVNSMEEPETNIVMYPTKKTEDEIVNDLLQQGFSYRQIAEEIGCSKSKVANIVKRIS